MMRSTKLALTAMAVALATPALAGQGPVCNEITQSDIESVLGVTLPGGAFPLPSTPGGVNQVIRADSEAVAGVQLNNVAQVAKAAGLPVGSTMKIFIGGCDLGLQKSGKVP